MGNGDAGSREPKSFLASVRENAAFATLATLAVIGIAVLLGIASIVGLIRAYAYCWPDKPILTPWAVIVDSIATPLCVGEPRNRQSP